MRSTTSTLAGVCNATGVSDRQHDVVAIGRCRSGRIVEVFREEGWPYANRSVVIREAIERVSEELRHKTPEEIFQYFIQRRRRRIHNKE